jgi:predicted amidohydrolase
MSSLSPDPADLFTELYDELDDLLGGVLQSAGVLQWLTDDTSQDVSSWIEGTVIELGELDPDRVRESIDPVDDPDDPEPGQQRRFAILCGLDRALAHVNPHTATYDQGALRSIAVRYAETGRLSSGAVSGALLPRFASAGRGATIPEALSEAFTSVVRVPEEAWARTSHTTLPAHSDFGRLDRQRGVLVGCAPLIESLDELEFELSEAEGSRLFSIGPSLAPVQMRIASVLRRLDEQGAAVGVMPELTLSDELLEGWRTAVLENPPDRTSRLKWLLVGTGPLGRAEPPPNRGVLIDRRTGDVLLSQDKIYPFTLQEAQLREWGLERALGSRACTEYMTRGEKITVAESGLGRVVMLICEDLSRIAQLGEPLLQHGISHAFAPVFSAETRAHYWEHAHAKDFAAQVGTQVVVANSLAVARAAGAEDPPGTALAHSPSGYVVGRCGHADAVCLFRISLEAAVTAPGTMEAED